MPLAFKPNYEEFRAFVLAQIRVMDDDLSVDTPEAEIILDDSWCRKVYETLDEHRKNPQEIAQDWLNRQQEKQKPTASTKPPTTP
jgi:hypothetical protein